jgi:diguanylate cyclase (GGDEF)-like protein
LVWLLVFTASWLGTITRPQHQLAAFWPANALLLGVFVRRPRWAMQAAPWLAALAAYLLAGVIAGDDPAKNLRLTAANLSGVVVGWLVFKALPDDVRLLSRPASMLWLLAASTLAAAAASLVGSLSANALLGIDWVEGVGFWFSAELSAYLILLPAVLLSPSPSAFLHGLPERLAAARQSPALLLPALALGASILLMMAVGGPGAIAFPVPALLWCALTYRMFTTSLVTLGLCAWTLVSIASGIVVIDGALPGIHDTISLRIGVALLAVAPLTVAAVNAARNRLMQDLDHAANHDSLTGALTRRAFLRLGRMRLDALADGGRNVSLLMLDIDHFKRINDAHGHVAGDEVLTGFATRMLSSLRPDDLLGRFGGEEFALLLPNTDATEAGRIAERLLRLAREHAIPLPDGTSLSITVSIGGVSRAVSAGLQLESLFDAADAALYAAKRSGRDRVDMA